MNFVLSFSAISTNLTVLRRSKRGCHFLSETGAFIVGWFYCSHFISEEMRIDQKNRNLNLGNSKCALCCRVWKVWIPNLPTVLLLMNQPKTWHIPDVLTLWNSDSNSTVSSKFLKINMKCCTDLDNLAHWILLISCIDKLFCYSHQ